MLNQDQYINLIAMINAYGDAEYHFGDFCSNTNAEAANVLYEELVDYIKSLCQEEK
jgi:hypothetical protein